MRAIAVLDTTLRDGELTDGVRFEGAHRLAIASLLDAIGVDVVEVAVWTPRGDQLADVRAIVDRVRRATLCVLSPSSAEAIDAAGAALQRAAAPRIHVYQGASQEDASVARAEAMVARARNLVAEVEFTPANGARAPLESVVAITRAALRGGATVISVADTAGRALPEDVARRVVELYEHVPALRDVCVSFHGHDDLGLATANTLAAVRAGAGQVEVAVNGLGARAGNAPLEEVVAAMREHALALGADTRIDDARLLEVSRSVAEISGLDVAPQKAIVGPRARWTGPRKQG